MTTLVAIKDLKMRLHGESFWREYHKGTEFGLMEYSQEEPRPLYAHVSLPDGGDSWAPLFNHARKEHKPIFLTKG